MKSNRVFISFAAEDSYARDFLVGQARNNSSPFVFTDLSVKQPWDNSWKTNCRTRIKGCDGVIALISPNTYNANGARWEMICADEEGIPMIGVYIQKDNHGVVPPELSNHRVIEWTWDGIAGFLRTL